MKNILLIYKAYLSALFFLMFSVKILSFLSYLQAESATLLESAYFAEMYSEQKMHTLIDIYKARTMLNTPHGTYTILPDCRIANTFYASPILQVYDKVYVVYGYAIINGTKVWHYRIRTPQGKVLDTYVDEKHPFEPVITLECTKEYVKIPGTENFYTVRFKCSVYNFDILPFIARAMAVV